jgi:hypothetical protein
MIDIFECFFSWSSKSRSVTTRPQSTHGIIVVKAVAAKRRRQDPVTIHDHYDKTMQWFTNMMTGRLYQFLGPC